VVLILVSSISLEVSFAATTSEMVLTAVLVSALALSQYSASAQLYSGTYIY